MRKKSELFFNLLLLPIDFVAVLAAYIAAYAIRVKIDGRTLANPVGFVLFLKIFLVILPVWILIFAVNGLYSQSGLRGRFTELGKIFAAVSGGTMFLILVDFLSKQPLFPAKSIPIYGYGLSFLFVMIGRQVVRTIQRSLFARKIGVHRALIVGSGPLAQRLLEDLKPTAQSGYLLLGAVDSARNADKRMKGTKVYQDFATAKRYAGKIDEIIQADSGLEPEEILEMVNYASNQHIIYRFVPNQFGLYAINSTMGALAGIPMIEIRKTPLDGWGRIFKRVFDLAGALFALLLLSPVMIATAVMVKFSTPGPIFYRHKRLSRTGKAIYVMKFRTMHLKYSTGAGYSGKTDAEILAEELGRPELVEEFMKEQKLNDDPRVTPLGKILRKTSIDELPQLFNVLKGELSLVGPRPIVQDELERYGEEQSTFLALKPGITGLWQISGRSDIGYEERVKLDIYYVENWTLWLDIKILFKTAISILKGRGAY